MLLNTLHLGNYGKRSLWAAYIDHKNLPFCGRCYGIEIHSLLHEANDKQKLQKCGNCCQWNMESDSRANNKVETSEHYPRFCDINSPHAPKGREVRLRYVKPVRLSFPWLICAARFAAHNVKVGQWDKTKLTAYLGTCAFLENVVKIYMVSLQPHE